MCNSMVKMVTRCLLVDFDLDQIVAVTAVGAALIAFVLVFAVVLIMAAVLMRKRKSSRTYGM